MNGQRGTGLPEVMITLLLASIITVALLNHYISMKRHYVRLQSAIEETMEMQLVGDFMRDSIRQAGFTPCLSVEQLITFDQRNGQQHLSAINVDTELNIQRMSPWFDLMMDKGDSIRIIVTPNSMIRADYPILIADCYHAEVQRVLHVRRTAREQIVTLANPMVFTYQPPVYVGEWIQERFFIHPSKGLFYQRVHTHVDELTPFVKTMSLKREASLIQVSLGLKGSGRVEFEASIRA